MWDILFKKKIEAYPLWQIKPSWQPSLLFASTAEKLLTQSAISKLYKKKFHILMWWLWV